VGNIPVHALDSMPRFLRQLGRVLRIVVLAQMTIKRFPRG